MKTILLILTLTLPTKAFAVEEFILDGLPSAVIRDTVTPANSVPLPVGLLGVSGALLNPATEEKQDDIITELQTANSTLTSLDGKDFATETTLLSVDTRLAGVLTVQATDLDIRDLTSATDSVSAVQSGTWNITNISGTISLPTGAATEATLSSLEGKDFATETTLATLATEATAAGIETELQTLNAVDFATEAKQDSQITELQDIESDVEAMSAKLPASLGQTTSSGSLSVVPASDYTPPASAVPSACTMKQAAITVGTSAVRLTTDGSAPSSTRRWLKYMLNPSSTANCYSGSSSVTSSSATRGPVIFPGALAEIVDDANDRYAICDTAGQTFFIEECE